MMNMTATKYFRCGFLIVVTATAVTGSARSHAQASSADSASGFAPVDQWKNAVIAGDAAALRAFSSSTPPAEVQANGVSSSADADQNFWLGLKARSMKLEIVRL